MVAPVELSPHKARELQSLTGLRALAASAVFVNHIGPWLGGTPISSQWQSVTYVAICGVVAFFVLSGFLLAQPESQRGGRRSFWRRRAARILPVYWLSLLVMVAITVYYDDRNPILRPVNLVANTLLVQSWGPSGTRASINLPAWSLSVELLFYACLPLLLSPLRVLIARAPRATLATFVALAQLGALAVYEGWVPAGFPPAYLPVFLLGVHAAVQPASWHRIRPAAAALVALVTVVVSLQRDYFGVAAVGMTVLIASLAHADRHGARTLLQGRLARRLGVWSYAFFLLHVPVGIVLLHFVPAPTSTVRGLALAALQFLLSWLAAAVTFHVYEEPARRWLVRTRDRPAV